LRPSDLFDEFAARHARGERPDVRNYLKRAGDGSDELSDLIDVYLRTTPAHEPGPEAVAKMEALAAGALPIQRLRIERQLTREAVVEALVRGLRLDVKKRGKVARYYAEFENGLLDPAQVDERVLGVLAKTLRAQVADLVTTRRPLVEAAFADLPPAPAAIMRARAHPSFSAIDEARPQPDEIDRLFGAAR
jgi:hypothetical protein